LVFVFFFFVVFFCLCGGWVGGGVGWGGGGGGGGVSGAGGGAGGGGGGRGTIRSWAGLAREGALARLAGTGAAGDTRGAGGRAGGATRGCPRSTAGGVWWGGLVPRRAQAQAAEPGGAPPGFAPTATTANPACALNLARRRQLRRDGTGGSKQGAAGAGQWEAATRRVGGGPGRGVGGWCTRGKMARAGSRRAAVDGDSPTSTGRRKW